MQLTARLRGVLENRENGWTGEWEVRDGRLREEEWGLKWVGQRT